MQKINNNKKGSMLIGVLVVMLMLSGIAISIISRTTTGTQMVTDMKKGFVAYQGSDQATEKILYGIKNLDEGKDKDGNAVPGSIPENTAALSVCPSNACFKDDAVTNASQIAEIIFLKSTAVTGSDLKRAIQAAVPTRVDNSGFGDFNVTSCADDPFHCAGIFYFDPSLASHNRCDAKVSWKWDTSSMSTEDRQRNAIDGFHVRQSDQSDLTAGEWYKASLGSIDKNKTSTFFENSATHIQTNANWTYTYAINAKNYNSFMLDSLYFNTTTGSNSNQLAVPAKSCPSSLSALGCVAPAHAPVGATVLNTPYTCCGGTQCYMPNPNWTANADKDCSLQTCSDGVVASADTSLQGGLHCNGGNSVACQTGTVGTECVDHRCSSCYATISYCSAKPTNSTPNSNVFSATSWQFNNYVKVYMGSGNDTQQPRSTYHTCPSSIVGGTSTCGTPTGGAGNFTPSFGSCTEKTDPNNGEYSATVNCSLSCNAGYDATGYKNNVTAGPLTKTFSNNCCFQNSPSATTCAAQNFECGGVPTWSPKCGGGSWDNSSCYNKDTCASDSAICPGANNQVSGGSCTPLCGGVNDTRTCSLKQTCSPTGGNTCGTCTATTTTYSDGRYTPSCTGHTIGGLCGTFPNKYWGCTASCGGGSWTCS